MGSLSNVKVLNRKEVEQLLFNVFKGENIPKETIEIGAGFDKGDGYQSFMTKVDISNGTNSVHLMVKCAPASPEFRRIVPIKLLFSREIYFYEEIFPALVRFQEKCKVDNVVRVPKYYASVKDEWKEKLVMENVKTVGYKLWNRKLTMDDEHVNLVMRQYGKLHAISVAMKEQQPKLFEKLSRKLSNSFTVWFANDSGMSKALEASIDKTVEGFCSEKDQLYINGITSIRNGVQGFCEFAAIPQKHSVIIHGDCWGNNIMFKYEDSKPKDICLLDFQLTAHGSPVLDIAYFIYVSCSKDQMDRLEDFLRVYYGSLSEHMARLGSDASKVFTFEDLKAEWKAYSKFGVVMAHMLIRLMLLDGDDAIDICDVVQGTCDIGATFKVETKCDAKATKRLKDIVVHLVDNGFL